MTMHASEQERGAPGEPKIIVEESLEYSNSPRATEAQIRLLRQETTNTKERMICDAALESPNEGVREIALAACAELWEQRRARLRARREEPQLAKLELYKEDDDPDEPSEEELRVGDLTGVLEILDSTPVGPRKATGTLPEMPVASAQLAEFPCPLCHRPILGDEDRGILRVPRHQIAVPVFPYGFQMPAHLIRCPASGSPITECCNRRHQGAPCGDSQCWQLPSEQPRPFSEDAADASASTNGLAPSGYPDHPPGAEFEDDGEIDGTVVDGERIPVDGWQLEPTMMAAGAFSDDTIAVERNGAKGDIDLAMARLLRRPR